MPERSLVDALRRVGRYQYGDVNDCSGRRDEKRLDSGGKPDTLGVRRIVAFRATDPEIEQKPGASRHPAPNCSLTGL